MLMILMVYGSKWRGVLLTTSIGINDGVRFQIKVLKQ
jgi:hypothetical protein